jgi:hypothetical protein
MEKGQDSQCSVNLEKVHAGSCLVGSAPFKTKTDCASALKTTRNTVTAYLDSEKVFNNKSVFSSIELSKQELITFSIPNKV